MEKLENWNKKQEDFFDDLTQEYGSFDFARESLDAKKQSERFINYFELTSDSSIIEFGCGRGEWLIKLANKGYYVWGIDLSEKSLEVLRNDLKKLDLYNRVQLIKGDVQGDMNAVLGGKKFSTVFCCNLLHHVLDIEKVVTNMVDVTAPRGKVIAYEPNPFHPWWYICSLFDKKFKWSVEKGLLKTSPLSIKRIFEKKGLEKIEIIPWDYFPFIAAEKTFHLADYFHNVFSKMPLLKYLSAVYVIGGYKK